jgi:hypothetical protein
MSLSVTPILITSQINIIRTKFNSLLTELDDLTVDGSGNWNLDGNLNIEGILTSDSHYMILNRGEAGAGVTDGQAAIIVDRGSLADAVLKFDEADDLWKVGLYGGTFTALSLSGHTHANYYTTTEADALFINRNGSLAMTGNFRLGAYYISRDGTATKGLSFDASHNASFSDDLTIGGNLVLVDSTNPLSLTLYNTYTAADNYERAFMKWNSNVLEIGIEKGSSGTLREMAFTHTGTLKFFTHNAEIVDDGTFNLPSITSHAFGWIVAGDNEERSLFWITAAGVVTLTSNSTNVVANADSDAKLCLGITSPEEPLTVKNRLAAPKMISLFMWYD